MPETNVPSAPLPPMGSMPANTQEWERKFGGGGALGIKPVPGVESSKEILLN